VTIMTFYLPSIPASLQTLGRCECVSTCALGVHRASRVRMDDGPRICGGVSADEHVQGHIACRVRSSQSQRGERWEPSRT